jgi:methyl-accepting chemotaxis protein
MIKIGIKGKMFMVGIIPALILFFFAAKISYDNYQTYLDVKSVNKKITVVDAASVLAHYSQIERGKSAAYLSGGIKLSNLKDHWSLNNKNMDKFTELFKNSSYSETQKTTLLKSVVKIRATRTRVGNKSIKTPEMLKAYTGYIVGLLNMQTNLSVQINNPTAAVTLRSLRILEEAKESGGKLRANMSAIFAKDKPIKNKKFKAIISFYAGLKEGLRSPGLALSGDNFSTIKNLVKQKNHKAIDSSFLLILQNYKEGKYYQDSKKFFSVISEYLDTVNSVIVSEKKNLEKQLQGVQEKAIYNFWLTLGLSIGFFLGLFYFINKVAMLTANKIYAVTTKLSDSINEVSDSSEKISTSSIELSESATESASSLQETVSSIDEISSMVQRNADAASSSTHVSTKSSEAATRGKKTVEQMITSINDISKSNDDIAEEMQKNNEDISKIVQVISEIGEKTKVINDIVFQTKLLSFNASVEAARAGEHGKGFAVVAEEVGNLASMSGKAALEITEMLDSSIKQVTEIVDNTKKKVEVLVSTSKEKVETGTKTAHECGDSLDEILQNVTSVNEMVREIATASSEQSTGVQEVTKAMQQLDQTTHKNTTVAQESSVMAKNLKSQASGLNAAVKELLAVVSGDSTGGSYQQVKSSEYQKSSDDSKVLTMPTFSQDSGENRSSSLKVSGLDTEIPDESDDRFEDL